MKIAVMTFWFGSRPHVVEAESSTLDGEAHSHLMQSGENIQKLDNLRIIDRFGVAHAFYMSKVDAFTLALRDIPDAPVLKDPILSADEIFERARRVIGDLIGAIESGRGINLDSHVIDDLGADSLDIVEITMSLEEEFGGEIPDDDLERRPSHEWTVQTAVEIIQHRLSLQ